MAVLWQSPFFAPAALLPRAARSGASAERNDRCVGATGVGISRKAAGLGHGMPQHAMPLQIEERTPLAGNRTGRATLRKAT